MREHWHRTRGSWMEALDFSMLSAFVDWYPMPDKGFHVLGMGGFARFRVRNSDGNVVLTATRPAFGLGAGYEWSVGRHWGLGAMARYTYASLQTMDSSDSAHETVTSPQVLLTATFY